MADAQYVPIPEHRSKRWKDGLASRFQASLAALQAALSSRSRNIAWVNELREVTGHLEELNRKTETGFLAIGGNLMALLNASRQLHSDISALTTLVSGTQVQQACMSLVAVRRYVQESQRRSANGAETLLTLQAAADHIHRTFSTLGEIVTSFQVTAVLARIETAHLLGSQQDLGNLADEVRSSSDAIQMRAEQVLESVEAFHTCVVSTLGEVSRLDALEETELPSLFAAVDADLAVFESRRLNAAAAASKLADDFNLVARDLGTIATSIQFHDITRQQVEHVIEAFAGLLRNAQGRAITPTGAELIKIQKAQLKGAAATFAQSIQKINRDLEEIGDRVRAMADAAKCILGLDAEEKDSFLIEMQRRFADIRAAVVMSLSSRASASTIIDDLDGLGKRLRDSVAEVQRIGLQLSRISINAAIRASHIGTPGEPLNVIASAIQSLQLECASRSQQANDYLDSIANAILCLSSAEGDRAAESSFGNSLPNDLDTGLEQLRSASKSSASVAAAVAKMANGLCGSLQEARDHGAIGDVFAETVDRCCEMLDRVGAQVAPVWSFQQSSSPKQSIEERYTMQAERDIHQAIATGAAPQTMDEVVIPGGEDVEFF